MILSGKKASESLLQKLSMNLGIVRQKIVAIQIGNNPASNSYLKIKSKVAADLGIPFEVLKFDTGVNSNEVISFIDKLNQDNDVGGIIIQLPIPESLPQKEILDQVSPAKDIDCQNTLISGSFYLYKGEIMPATPKGVLRLLEFYDIEVSGKDVIVIGRSNLVGKPLANALVNKDATVTLCHSKTSNLQTKTKSADIIISAVGKPKFLTKEFFRNDNSQVVIDIGITNVDGKLDGDVDFENVVSLVKDITPVPGGVGPMTVYGLFENYYLLTRNMDSL